MGYKKKTTTSNAETQQITPTLTQPAPEPTPVISDEERKQIIANKRRETLAKAREMRTPKHEIRKQAQETIQNKDELIKSKEEVIKTKDEIIKTKEQELGQTKQDIENNRIKMLEDNVIMMKKLLSDKTPSVEVVKPKRIYKPKEPKPKPVQQPQPQQPQQPTTDTLIDKSYREQLQERLREQVFNKIMKDTFS